MSHHGELWASRGRVPLILVFNTKSVSVVGFSNEGMYQWETKWKRSKPIYSATNHMKMWFISECTLTNSADHNPFQEPDSLNRSRNSLLIMLSRD